MADIVEGGVFTIAGIPLPGRRTRRAIVTTTIVFTWACIGSIMAWGDPANSLHQSALSWSYSTMLAVIFAYVFGAVTDNYTVWKNAPKQ